MPSLRLWVWYNRDGAPPFPSPRHSAFATCQNDCPICDPAWPTWTLIILDSRALPPFSRNLSHPQGGDLDLGEDPCCVGPISPRTEFMAANKKNWQQRRKRGVPLLFTLLQAKVATRGRHGVGGL